LEGLPADRTLHPLDKASGRVELGPQSYDLRLRSDSLGPQRGDRLLVTLRVLGESLGVGGEHEIVFCPESAVGDPQTVQFPVQREVLLATAIVSARTLRSDPDANALHRPGPGCDRVAAWS